MIKQKTLRFYSESNEDKAAYERISRYREYGFNNAREFVIAAINDWSEKPTTEVFDVDDLAQRIVDKLARSNVIINSASANEVVNDPEDSEIYDKALSFINNL